MKALISAIAIVGLCSMTACNRSAVQEKEAALQAQQHTIDSMNAELAKKHVIDSMNEVTKTQYVLNPPVNTTTQVVPVAPVSSTRRTVRHSSASHTRSAASSGNTVSQSQPVVYQEAPAEPAKKKGWSAKAKGAVIGAGTGAAAGAIINGRNRGAGAIIGGVLGAAAGTGAGAIIDKKKGR